MRTERRGLVQKGINGDECDNERMFFFGWMLHGLDSACRNLEHSVRLIVFAGPAIDRIFVLQIARFVVLTGPAADPFVRLMVFAGPASDRIFVLQILV